MDENFTTNSTSVTNRKLITICFESDHPAIKASRVLAYVMILLVSLTGNTLVIGVSWQDRKMRKPVNYLIANMAAADLAITVVYMPRMISSVIRSYDWLVRGTLGLALCKTVPTLHLVSIKVSILTLVFLSVERFLAVSVVIGNKLTVRRVKIIFLLVWLTSLAAHVPNMYALKLTPGQKGALICRAYLNKFFGSSNGRRIYDNTLTAIFYAIPLFVIIVLYSMTAIKLRKRKVPGDFAKEDGGKTRREKMNANVFKTLFSVTLAFFTCWLAYFIMRKGVIGVSISCNVQFIRYFFAHANSAITPCLYIIFSQKYRRCLTSILTRLACRVRRRAQSGTTLSLISQSATSLGSLSVFPQSVSLVSLKLKMEDRMTPRE